MHVYIYIYREKGGFLMQMPRTSLFKFLYLLFYSLPSFPPKPKSVLLLRHIRPPGRMLAGMDCELFVGNWKRKEKKMKRMCILSGVFFFFFFLELYIRTKEAHVYTRVLYLEKSGVFTEGRIGFGVCMVRYAA